MKGTIIMNRYYDNASKEIKEYFKVLEPEFPEWLNEYISCFNCMALYSR